MRGDFLSLRNSFLDRHLCLPNQREVDQIRRRTQAQETRAASRADRRHILSRSLLPLRSAIVASTQILDFVNTTSRSLLGEEGADTLTSFVAQISRTLERYFLSPSTGNIFPVESQKSKTWSDTFREYLTALSDILPERSSLENSSLLLVLCTFAFLLVRNMSWTSRFGNLGRFSPFTRSPPATKDGHTTIDDSDFSYITADDLRRQQNESVAPRTESPVDYGPQRDTDMLTLRNKRKEYTVHFPVYSIAKGELTIGTVRDATARKTGTSDPNRIKLLYKGKNLKDDHHTCKQEGLKDGSEILCTIAEVVSGSTSESDEDEDSFTEATDGRQANGDGTGRRRRNRGKKTKRRNKRNATSGTSTPDQQPSNLGVPAAQGSTRAPSPQPTAAPSTPLDKLDALENTLSTFRAEVENFERDPPPDQAKKDFEYKRLSETILTQVLLKLDGVETDGDENARMRRKALVRDTQEVLQRLDTMKR